MISLIAAVADNGVIGKENELPWNLPNDLKRFRKLTKEHTVVMGRKTYESIIKKLGKPLPDRTNIIVTRQADFAAPDCTVLSWKQALERYEKSDEEVFVIGGSEIYRLALPYAQKLYLTHVHGKPEGDARFPHLNADEWQATQKEFMSLDKTHEFDSTFIIYERK